MILDRHRYDNLLTKKENNLINFMLYSKFIFKLLKKSRVITDGSLLLVRVATGSPSDVTHPDALWFPVFSVKIHFSLLTVVNLLLMKEAAGFRMTRTTMDIIKTILELIDITLRSRKKRLTAVEIRCADHATTSIPKSWHELRRQVAVARSV
jgi:hypothetical protein